MSDRLGGAQQRLDWLASRLIHPADRIGRLHQRLIDLSRRLILAQTARRNAAVAALLAITARLHRLSPAAPIRQGQLRIDHQRERLALAIRQNLERAGHRLGIAAGRLETLSPLATLARGYAIVHGDDTGVVILDAAQLRCGQRIRVLLARGSLKARVEETEE